MVSEDTPLATIAASMTTPSTQPQAVKFDAPSFNDSLGEPSRKQHFKIFDILVLFICWSCFVIAVITITPRLDIAWTLQEKYQLQVIGLLLSIMYQCLTILAPKLWIMAEAWRSKPKLQNLDAILRNSIMTTNAYMAWRALLLLLIVLPLALSLGYKTFIGGSSSRSFSNHTSWYGLTAAPGLTSYGTLKFGPSYMTNATLPFIMASPDPTTRFPQTYGFNHLVISNTSSAFLDVPLSEQVPSLQQSLQKDIASSFTLTADVHATVTTYNHSIEESRDNDAFWDFYLNQRGRNSTPVSFSTVIDTADLCSGRTLGMLTGDDSIDASWIVFSFFKTSNLSISPDVWIPEFRANAFLFNTRREICHGTWQITYNSIHLVKGNCSVSSPLPKQDFLVTPSSVFKEYNFQFSTYYTPSLVEYLAPLSPPVWDTTEQVYRWGDASVMPTFATSVAAMYWSRMTVLFGPDSYVNQDYHTTLPAWNSEVNYTVPDTLLSTRRTIHPSWALYILLVIQPILSTLIFVATFVLSHFSAVDGSNFGIISILAGVRTETLKLLEGASFSGTLKKPVSVQISEITAKNEKRPQIEYYFHDDRSLPKPSFTAVLRNRFTTREKTGYHQIKM